MTDFKQEIKYFVSYAHEDEKEDGIVSHLVKNLKKNFGSSKKYIYKGWIDENILAGKNWAEEIKKALEECDFGLMLISLDFLNSKYISKNELPILLNSKECSIPVGLRYVSIQKHDLKGLEERQIFIKNGAFYEDLDSRSRRAFVFSLFEDIEETLDTLNQESFNKEEVQYFREELSKYEEIGSREINREESLHKEMTNWLQQFMDNKGDTLIDKILRINEEKNIKKPETPLEIKYFRLDVRRFIRKICYSLANNDETRIDTPVVNHGLHFNSFDIKLYRDFFTELLTSIPRKMPENSKHLLKEYSVIAVESIL